MTSARPSAGWPAAFWALVVAGMLALAAQWLWSVHLGARKTLETLEPRYARLAGLGAARTKLQEAASQATRSLERHVYPGNRDASQAGNDAQQRVRDVFSKAGLEVVSIQVLPARNGRQFDRIPISMRVEGEFQALQATLAALPSLTPTIFVEGLVVQGASGLAPETAAQRVVIELQLYVLRTRA